MLRVGSLLRICSANMSSGSMNRLGSELSPYLRQHKDNPVHWYPWGQEAIQRARSEEKMIFLSIGYSTCHWCHVMERESFESEEVAAVMNAHYINIKVDREERPDVDKVYMTFVQATTGGGGWPLSIFLSPDLNPIYGGTYFPPSGRYGRPGFTQILQALASQWEDNKDDMLEAGREVIKIIDQKSSGSSQPGPIPQPAILQKFFAQLSKNYDPEFGGYSGAPKFPQPSNLLTMFKLHAWSGEMEDRRKRELEMNLHTLDMMNKGGIHDHVSQGFARYSTDEKWHVPHFEKMLYDQAQLTVVYSIAFQLTNQESHQETVEDILTYVTRDLAHPLGGFFTAEDADSLPTATSTEKKEGAFCVWTRQEIKDILNEKIEGSELTLGDVVIHEMCVEEEGNVNPRQDPHGELVNKNVLTRIHSKGALSLEERSYKRSLKAGLEALHRHRLTRPRPALDDKILCSSNGLMISGLCAAGSALTRQDYLETALKAGNFIRQHMFDSDKNQLLRSVYGGKQDLEQLSQPIHGFIDDYAFAIQGMLDLYTSTFDPKWLEFALRLQDIQDAKFLDGEKGGYFATEAGDPEIVIRLKDDQDGAEPSSNSISALNLLRLSKLTGEQTFRDKAEAILKLFHTRLTQIPLAMPALVDAFLFFIQDGPILVFNSDESSSTMVSEIRRHFLPSLTLLALNDIVVDKNDALQGLVIEPGTGVLIDSAGKKSVISNVEQVKELMK